MGTISPYQQKMIDELTSNIKQTVDDIAMNITNENTEADEFSKTLKSFLGERNLSSDIDIEAVQEGEFINFTLIAKNAKGAEFINKLKRNVQPDYTKIKI